MANHPIESLRQSGSSRTTMAVVIVALLVVSALGFFLFREYAAHRGTQQALNRARQAEKALRSEAEDAVDRLEQYKSEVVKLSDNLKEAQETSSKAEKRRDQVVSQLESIKKQYETKLESLQRHLRERESIVRNLEGRLKRYLDREGEDGNPAELFVPLESVSVAPSGIASQESISAQGTSIASGREAAGGAATKPPQGEVITVDRAHRFIIVNIGSEKGSRKGRYVQIYRGSEKIGSARVDETQQGLSAATVFSDDTLHRIQEGDRAYLALG